MVTASPPTPPSPLPEQNPAVRRTLPEHFRTKNHSHDTAGIPWRGRDYAPSPFPDDAGERSGAVERALAAFDEGADVTREGIVAALRGERVLIPIQAIATDTEVTASGLHADNASDMAIVKIQFSSGEVALPVFTSVAALGAWNREARPVPMVCEQAAQAAVAEGCTMLLVDLGRDKPIALSRSALWALGQGREWLAPHHDPVVLAEIELLARHLPAVTKAALVAGDTREVELILTLVPGLNREALQATLQQVQRVLAGSQVIAERVSSLKISLR